MEFTEAEWTALASLRSSATQPPAACAERFLAANYIAAVRDIFLVTGIGSEALKRRRFGLAPKVEEPDLDQALSED